MAELIERSFDFYATEAKVFMGGPFAYVQHLADGLMCDVGGIKPYSYSCVPLGWGSFKLTVSEVKGPYRTPAQRALIKVKAAQRTRQAQRTSAHPERSA